MPARLFGEERVLWRDGRGVSHVWHNRCIHRGMRLEYGFVDGDRLACRYHGWRFGEDARCVHIPAHPDMTPPEDFRIQACETAEAGGLIWTTVGAPSGPPAATRLDNLHFCRTIAIAADAADIVEALPAIGFPFLLGRGEPVFAHEQEAPGLLTIRSTGADAPGETLVLAVQPTAKGACQVHVLANAATDDTTALRRHFARWARRFRWFMENGRPPDMSWDAKGIAA